mmetsp:Transcript_23988/g.80599  ORF Transcript_23988/g.80599 Transcript_23988/m.80599 type:complete len:227 (-) Transcript_23988:621-1301(-)
MAAESFEHFVAHVTLKELKGIYRKLALGNDEQFGHSHKQERVKAIITMCAADAAALRARPLDDLKEVYRLLRNVKSAGPDAQLGAPRELTKVSQAMRALRDETLPWWVKELREDDIDKLRERAQARGVNVGDKDAVALRGEIEALCRDEFGTQVEAQKAMERRLPRTMERTPTRTMERRLTRKRKFTSMAIEMISKVKVPTPAVFAFGMISQAALVHLSKRLALFE